LALTVLSGGASATSVNLTETNNNTVQNELAQPRQLGTKYVTVKLGIPTQLYDPWGDLTFKISYLHPNPLIIDLSTSGIVKGKLPGTATVFSYDLNGNIVYEYKITVIP